jgi:2'-hydroxyisoflavone reductase
MRRREFLGTAATAAALSLLPADGAAGVARAPLRILILGGTGFIGPHMVRLAVDRGHHVTTFTRGRRQPWLFDDYFDRVEELHGDRSEPGGLDALNGRQWNVVIDNSGNRVEWARDSAELLRDSVQRYIYISSTGVFLPYLRPDIDERVQPLLADDPPLDQPSFGVMKAQSEQHVRRVFGERAVLVRPHYIVGPGDTTYRFPFWPQRLERGGTVLVPGRPADRVQFIDVRDLTEWIVRDVVEGGLTGVYNAAGPRHRHTMEEFVYGAHAVFSSEIDWVWIDDYDFLLNYPLRQAPDGRSVGLAANVPWIMPRDDNQFMAHIDSRKAVAAGLRWRPVAETVRAAIDWWNHDAPREWVAAAAGRFPYTPEQEVAMIAAWRTRG